MSARYGYAVRLHLDGDRITVGVTRENTITMTPDPGVLTPDEAHRLAVALVNCAEFARDQIRAALQPSEARVVDEPTGVTRERDGGRVSDARREVHELKLEISAVSTGPGRADIIAHYPPRGGAAGFRARIGHAAVQEGSGRWKALLYAKAYRLSEGVPSIPATCATEFSRADGPRGRHTLRSLVQQLRQRDQWWSE